MRIVIVIAFMLTGACAKKGPDSPSQTAAACESFAYPYMVEYIDGSIVKSDVTQCGSEFTAKALDQSGRTITAESLTIQLNDVHTGTHYLTSFQGQ